MKRCNGEEELRVEWRGTGEMERSISWVKWRVQLRFGALDLQMGRGAGRKPGQTGLRRLQTGRMRPQTGRLLSPSCSVCTALPLLLLKVSQTLKPVHEIKEKQRTKKEKK
jgi:hypothetical protein